MQNLILFMFRPDRFLKPGFMGSNLYFLLNPDHPAILRIQVQTIHKDGNSLLRLPYAVIANGAFRGVWQSVRYWQGTALRRHCERSFSRSVAICQLLAGNYEDHCIMGRDL
ncbi:MAG: hypothetical protein HC819_22690 [Cyclobacteriaceae bacterium]|nr:hypothetical protein [Cyclobacteriaceae bacterium]